MADRKEQVADAIVRARDSLGQALSALEHLHMLDPSTVAFSAHALNNYLTIIGGTAELLQESLTAHPDPQIHAWLAGLQHATDLMTRTVSRLMSNTMTQDIQLLFEQADLPVLVQRVCRYYQRVADHKDIRLLYDPMDKVPPVGTDRVAVAAVLDNLLSNAIKYSPLGKHIWIQVRRDRDSVVCSVQDEGPGLSQEEQTRLFQRGVRLSPVPTGGEPSTGYGLAVAKELIERLHGEIWCVSTPGQGACFSFRLPAYHALEPEPRPSVPESHGGPEPTGRTNKD
jgi:two-component system, sensor histidine kinase LadS